jgi:histidinol-phosphatase (PHP family)
MPSQNQIMKANYHTHMYLCRHAIGTVDDYVESAIANGLSVLGMSDHGPFEELKDRSIRMHPDEFSIYLHDCNEAIRKYSDRIKIYKGLEIEYFDGHEQHYAKLLSQLDYLALGQHYIPSKSGLNGLKSAYTLSKPADLEMYADTLVKAMSTGNFKFVCHPDLMLFGYGTFDETAKRCSLRIIEAAVQNEIPLEINANGIRRGMYRSQEGLRYIYPRQEFWELVQQHHGKVIISSDAHDPAQIYDDAIPEAYEFAARLGIEVAEVIKI